MARYFLYVPYGRRVAVAPSGSTYFFEHGVPTTVADADGDYFLYLGTPENPQTYVYRETDAAGNPLYPHPGPPLDPATRVGMIDIRRFPSDRGLPPAAQWRKTTEDYDPTIYYHKIRVKRRRGW